MLQYLFISFCERMLFSENYRLGVNRYLISQTLFLAGITISDTKTECMCTRLYTQLYIHIVIKSIFCSLKYI